MQSSFFLSVGGEGVGGDVEQRSHAQSLLRYQLHFKSPEHFACICCIDSSLLDWYVASTNGAGVLCSRVWIRMYVARHLEEQ